MPSPTDLLPLPTIPVGLIQHCCVPPVTGIDAQQWRCQCGLKYSAVVTGSITGHTEWIRHEPVRTVPQ